jgi:hypothetical protein
MTFDEQWKEYEDRIASELGLSEPEVEAAREAWREANARTLEVWKEVKP